MTGIEWYYAIAGTVMWVVIFGDIYQWARKKWTMSPLKWNRERREIAERTGLTDLQVDVALEAAAAVATQRIREMSEANKKNQG